jgi:hypothetical protein
MKVCSNCNHKNSNTAKYCIDCGNEFRNIESIEEETKPEIKISTINLDSNLKQIISLVVKSLGYLKITSGNFSVIVQDENGNYVVSTKRYNSEIDKKLNKYGFGKTEEEMFYPLLRSDDIENELEEILIFVFYDAFNFNLIDYKLETNIAQISDSFRIPYVKVKSKSTVTSSNPPIKTGLSYILREFKIPIYGLIALTCIYYLFNHDRTEKLPTRQEMIKSQFSGFSGKHTKLCEYIKNHLNDPDSFDHVQSKYFDQGSYLVVIVTYRAKNLFGGVVTSYCKAKVDLDGNILEIIENIPLI